ncbi:hypothetical protein [Muriicola sp.]|uniref:hypothetical protein n=1 Tax=Muriicola sp. TaxID=2020856 RepID=UPI0035695BAF
MNRLHFSIDIEAEKSTIWKALWDLASYRDWAGVFFEGSYAVTDGWKEGSTVLFLNPDQNGIYSEVETHVPDKIMKFRHIGNVVDGKPQPLDEETRLWSGSTEQYTLVEGEGQYTLIVDIDIMDEHLDFMKSTFPKALDKIKKKCT